MSFWKYKALTPEEIERRQKDANLKRIARESDIQDSGQIQKWIELGKKILGKDDDPDPASS